MSDFVQMEWAAQALKECYYDGMRKKGVEVEDNVVFYQLSKAVVQVDTSYIDVFLKDSIKGYDIIEPYAYGYMQSMDKQRFIYFDENNIYNGSMGGYSGFKYFVEIRTGVYAVIASMIYCAPGYTSDSIWVCAVVEKKNFKALNYFMYEWHEYNNQYQQKVSRMYSDFINMTVGWGDLHLHESMKMDIRNNIENFFKAKDFYAENKLPYKRGMLFVGSPGNGKSMTVNLIRQQYVFSDVKFIVKREIADMISDITNAYKENDNEKTRLVVIEEIDKITSIADVQYALLNAIDGTTQMRKSNGGILTLATANEPNKIHKAFTKRPSRFDRVFIFKNPGMDMKIEYLMRLMQKCYTEDEIRYVLENTDMFSMAAVKEVFVNAYLSVVSQQREPTLDEFRSSAELIRKQFNSSDNDFEENGGSSMGFRRLNSDADELVYNMSPVE